MPAWIDIPSFIFGFTAGLVATALAITVSVKIKSKRTGDTRKSNQKNITAAGDVVGGDKVTSLKK